MQFWRGFIKIIFVLSTIVIVTDCCSSRILMLREHALKNFVERQQQQQQQQQDQQQQQQQDDVDAGYQAKVQQEIELEVLKILNEMEVNRTYALEIDRMSDMDPEGERLLQILGIRRRLKSTTTESPTTTTTTTRTTVTTLPTVSSVTVAPTTPAQTDERPLQDPTHKHTGDHFSRECGPKYIDSFCMNSGLCVRYPIGESSIYSCICAEGFLGERCELKTALSTFYTPPPDYYPKPKIVAAFIVPSFSMLLLLSLAYVTFAAFMFLRRQQQLEARQPVPVPAWTLLAR